MKIIIKFRIFEIFMVPNFTLNNFKLLCWIYSEKVFLIQNRKSKHPVRILHIRNSLGIEFHFKWTFLNIWTKIDQRRSFHIITVHFLMRKAEICSFSERVLIEKNSWTLFASIASVITISIFQSWKHHNNNRAVTWEGG